jgi:agmatinase
LTETGAGAGDATSAGDGAPADNFAGVASRAGGDPERARIVIVPAPFEGTVSYGTGAARGPAAILAASRQVETWDDETGLDLEDLSFALGPAVTPADDDPVTYADRVAEALRPLVASGRLPFVLGGEHSVTVGAVRAVRETHPRAHVLVLDAHADLRDRYEGSSHSHACVSRRLLEGGPVTIVGVRSLSREEATFAAAAPELRLVRAREALAPGFAPDELAASLGDPVYVSVDVDALDPAVIPGTGTPEPGGLDWYHVTDLLTAVASARRIVAADVTEVRPIPSSNVTEFLAAKLMYRLIGVV